ncbi:DinB family protein [Pseudomonas sp. SO81]|uniref:DinB family protein n=1 Tax=Pseudomonas sp. SO81 TaxID=2983246 RepID=UPI0025A3E186|nr:DinB family protein [Pseudomonas sp. SO81]WJN60740.1 DNA damage-inducible protein DinB [Pseudomonas sp. SO81]
MITPNTVILFAQYKRWADQVLLNSLAELPPEELVKVRAGPLKNFIGILNHVHVIDRIWQGNILQREHGHKSRMEVPYPEFFDLYKAQEEMNEWFTSWAKQQTEDSLAMPLDFHFLSGQPGNMTVGAMFLHVANHATFHRGWITQLYFEIPAPPPVTDLCVYLTEVSCAATLSC